MNLSNKNIGVVSVTVPCVMTAYHNINSDDDDYVNPEAYYDDNTSPKDIANLTYHDVNPFEVRLVVNDNEDCAWVFSRDILRDALRYHASGLGDVHCWHDGGNKFFLKLSSPEGTSTLQFPAKRIAWFVREMYDVMPDGAEEVSFDVALVQILDEWDRY